MEDLSFGHFYQKAHTYKLFSSFSGILSLKYGFQLIKKFDGMLEISKRVHFLARYLYENLSILKHENGSNVVKIYTSSNYSDHEVQGGIVNFNILQRSGKNLGT